MGSGEGFVEVPSVFMTNHGGKLDKNLFTLSLESFTHLKCESSFCNCTVFNWYVLKNYQVDNSISYKRLHFY